MCFFDFLIQNAYICQEFTKLITYYQFKNLNVMKRIIMFLCKHPINYIF